MPRVIIVFFPFQIFFHASKGSRNSTVAKVLQIGKMIFFSQLFLPWHSPSTFKYFFVLVFSPPSCPKYYIYTPLKNGKVYWYLISIWQSNEWAEKKWKIIYKEVLKAYYSTNFLIACASTLLKSKKPNHFNYFFYWK